MILAIILIIIMLFLVSIMSSAQVALIAVSDAKVLEDAENKHKKALKIQKFNEQPKHYTIAIQSNIVFLIMVSSALVYTVIYQNVLSWFTVSSVWYNILIIIVLGFIFITLFVVLGILIPRRIANKRPDKVAYRTIGFIEVITTLSMPFVYIFAKLSVLIGHLFKLSATDGERLMTEEDIRTIVEESSKIGNIDESESEMIQNVFDFSDTTVDEIMTHRTEISAIPINATKDEVLNIVEAEHYTRFPVFEKDIDHIVGTLHVKDLLKYMNHEEKFDLKSILRKPYFIPDSKKTSELFNEMQKQKNHIAIVIDEYGGTAGLVTVEDLIEEIVGNIFDEYDEVEEEIVKVNDHTYEIDGLANIDDVEDEIKADLPVEDYDTLSGFILGQLGRLPEINEKISIKFGDYTFTVLEIEGNIITKVKATKNSEKEDEL